MMKRIIPLALVLVLLVSVLPVTAFAASGTSRSDAIPVNLDEAYTHTWTADNDDKNHYISFTVPSRGLIAIACTYPVDDGGDYGDMQFEIYNQSGTCIWRTNTDYETPVEGMAIAITGLNAGKYYMNITPRFTVASGEFEIFYALTFVAADDTMGTEAEPNNSKTMADTLTPGKEFAGVVGENCGDHECGYDYWKYSNTNAVGYRVYVPEWNDTWRSGKIIHYDSNGKAVTITAKDIRQTSEGVYFFDVASTKGTNYLQLYRPQGALMPYTLWIEPFKNEPLTITKQPESITVTGNVRVTVSVEATGELLSYTWYAKNYGETEFTATSVHEKEYQVSLGSDPIYQEAYCLITDAHGNTVKSDTVTLCRLLILQQPREVLVTAGEVATVQFQAVGDTLTYQWYTKDKGASSFSPAEGFTTNTYSVTMDTAVSGRQLYCVVTDKFGNTKQTETVAIGIPEDLRSSGTCGDNVTWKLTFDGLLTISGTGPMAEYTSSINIPWHTYKKRVKKVVVEEGVTTLCAYAFVNCETLVTAKLPDTLDSIGSQAFEDCASLTSVNFPDGLQSIDSRAFDHCKVLTVVELPDGLQSIGSSAFSACESITEVTIPDSVTEIGSSAFSYCYALKDVTLPKGIKEISDYTFRDCNKLTTVVIPVGVTTIGKYAFEDIGTKRIVIPATVTSIGDGAFYSCNNLTAVYYGGTDRSAITIGTRNTDLLNATWHYDHTGDILYIPGDLDGDGEISDWDGVLLARYLAGWNVEIDLAAADVDGDGEVSDWDGVVLDRYLAGWNVTIG